MRLIDTYRPNTIAEIAGHIKVKEQIRRVVGREGWDRGAFLICGPTGTGKTCFARAIAKDVCKCDPFNVREYNGANCGIDQIREIEEDMRFTSLFGNGRKATIVNECQTLWAQGVQALLSMLDDLPCGRLFIFTTSRKDEEDGESWLFSGAAAQEFDSPFADRCTVLELEADEETLVEMAAKAKEIAAKHGMDGLPAEAYLSTLKAHKGSMRALLQAIEKGEVA